MNTNPRAAFFDGIAEKWDGWEDQAELEQKLSTGLDELGVRGDETVLDVGCGTGNLTRALLAKLSPAGRVVAVDISPRMIDVARSKVTDARVTWHVADASRLPLGDASCQRVVCFSVWPHFDDQKAVAIEMARVLPPGGYLHVWHLIPRRRVNEIHATAGAAVQQDVLAPAEETALLLGGVALRVSTVSDTDDRYLVTARKPER